MVNYKPEDVFDSDYYEMKNRIMFDKPRKGITEKTHSRSCLSGIIPKGDFSREERLRILSCSKRYKE